MYENITFFKLSHDIISLFLGFVAEFIIFKEKKK